MLCVANLLVLMLIMVVFDDFTQWLDFSSENFDYVLIISMLISFLVITFKVMGDMKFNIINELVVCVLYVTYLPISAVIALLISFYMYNKKSKVV